MLPVERLKIVRAVEAALNDSFGIMEFSRGPQSDVEDDGVFKILQLPKIMYCNYARGVISALSDIEKLLDKPALITALMNTVNTHCAFFGINVTKKHLVSGLQSLDFGIQLGNAFPLYL